MRFDEPPDDNQEPSRSRRPLLIIGGGVLLVLAFIGGRVLAPLVRGDKPAPAPAAASKAEAPAPSPAPVAQPAAPEVETPREVKPRTRKKAEPPPPEPAAPAAPTTGELHITSDVPGAMVFLDRVFLGNSPVTAKEVTPGSHKINASVDGYDAYSDTIEVAPGPAEIAIRFKEVRLNATVDVVHKHGVGSCEGRLVADPQGVRYETPNKDDAFSLKFSDIETFEVDYLKKNLRIKRRGGKTWNFSTKAATADPLFVFHRDVDKVRKQVAGK